MQGASVNVGELWATYDVELFKPTAMPLQGFTIPAAHYGWSNNRSGVSGPTSAAPLTGLDLYKQITGYASLYGDTIGMVFTGSILKFPVRAVGYYKISFWWVGSTTSVVSPSITYANCTSIGFVQDGTGSVIQNTGTSSANLFFSVLVLVSNPALQATLTLTGATLPTSVVQADMFVEQCNWPTYAGLLPIAS